MTPDHNHKPMLAAGILAAMLAFPSHAAVTPLSMRMESDSKSCILDCIPLSSYARDQDSVNGPFGAFADLSVSTAVAAGANSFVALASGSTTIDGDTQFTVQLDTNRPSVTHTTGSYSTHAELTFSFSTDDAGGTMGIAYSIGYQRPVGGSTLGTGVNFSTPQILVLTGAHSALPESFNSLAGSDSGTWSYTLDPNRFYTVTLSADNTRSFSAPAGFGADTLNATYVVTLPSFAQPVPEPAEWGMLLAGLGMVGAAVRRRRKPAAEN